MCIVCSEGMRAQGIRRGGGQRCRCVTVYPYLVVLTLGGHFAIGAISFQSEPILFFFLAWVVFGDIRLRFARRWMGVHGRKCALGFWGVFWGLEERCSRCSDDVDVGGFQEELLILNFSYLF